MKPKAIQAVLWAHTGLTALAGWGLFLFPQALGPLWPWALPPLAARFMGSLLIGGSACTALTVLSPAPPPLAAPALLGVGDALIASVGVFSLLEAGLTLRMIIWLLVFLGTAALLIALPFLGERGEAGAGRGLSRALRIYFIVHLCAVVPVGLTMYLAPVLAQKLWPWALSIDNVRLLGAFFVGAAVLSIWCLRQTRMAVLRPLLGLYAVFTSLATLASILHFGLFNPARVVTWAFFLLYVLVAAGAWYFLAASQRRSA